VWVMEFACGDHRLIFKEHLRTCHHVTINLFRNNSNKKIIAKSNMAKTESSFCHIEELLQKRVKDSAFAICQPNTDPNIRATLEQIQKLYILKLREIELIRLTSQIFTISVSYEFLGNKRIEQRLQLLDNAQQQGQQLLQTWTQSPLNVENEQSCVERLQQTLSLCAQLRQDLLALKTVTPKHISMSKAAQELLDTFNALPDVGGFTAGFKKLEDEYFRLQAESVR